jgi:hypothetical protein
MEFSYGMNVWVSLTRTIRVSEQRQPRLGRGRIAVGVESLIVHQPKIAAFAEIVAQSQVHADPVVHRVKVHQGDSGETRAGRDPDPETSNVHVEAGVPVRKADAVELVRRPNFEVA